MGDRARPDRLRVLGLTDTMLLWGSLGVSLLVIVLGGLLVPALSLPQALLAIVVGGIVRGAMLGVAGLIEADGRVPTMVLLRAPLGRVGSYGATALNAAQCLGWSVFELIVIATAAGARSPTSCSASRRRGCGRSSSARSPSGSPGWAPSASCAACCVASPSGSCSRRSST